MKIKTIIIDDEKASISALKWELENFGDDIEIIGSYHQPKEGLKAIKEKNPDLVFLDIEMPGMNGFELLKNVTNINFDLIFVTAYDQFAIKAFKVCALDYLLKPVDEDDLKIAIEKVKERKTTPVSQLQLEHLFENLRNQMDDFETIALPTMEGLEFVEIDDIIYCESDSNYTNIFMKNDDRLLVSKTLKDIEQTINCRHFSRVHHSFLVNLKFAKKYIKGKGGLLVLKNGKNIPVSRTKKEELLNLF